MNAGVPEILIAFLIYGGGAYLGVRALEFALKLKDVDGKPLPSFDDRLVGVLALLTGCVGAYNLTQRITLVSLVLIGLVCVVLDYACCADLRCGRVPILAAVPLAIAAAGVDVAVSDPISIASGVLIGTPFAAAAFMARRRSAGAVGTGYGGYGDAAIAALGGFVLGVQLGIIAVAIACFAAAGVGLAMKRQGGMIPFAPFLAVTLQFALFVPALRSAQFQ